MSLSAAEIDAVRALGNLARFRGGLDELLVKFTALPPATEVGVVARFQPLEIPAPVGLGTYRYKGGLAEHLDAVPWLDTAEGYGFGRVEEAIGRANTKRVLIATKVARTHLSHNSVLNACERSLKRLKRDYVWLYQIHWPSGRVPVEETVFAIKALQRRGLVQNWGVCNFSVGQIEAVARACGEFPASVQVRYNLLDREIEGFLLPYCNARGIKVIAYSPLGQNYRVFASDPRWRVNEGDQSYLALSWLLAKGVYPIPATNTLEHLESNLAVEPLEPGKVRELDRRFPCSILR